MQNNKNMENFNPFDPAALSTLSSPLLSAVCLKCALKFPGSPTMPVRYKCLDIKAKL